MSVGFGHDPPAIAENIDPMEYDSCCFFVFIIAEGEGGYVLVKCLRLITMFYVAANFQ